LFSQIWSTQKSSTIKHYSLRAYVAKNYCQGFIS